jgi:hypothetical protein
MSDIGRRNILAWRRYDGRKARYEQGIEEGMGGVK